jgi:hypothetical protein
MLPFTFFLYLLRLKHIGSALYDTFFFFAIFSLTSYSESEYFKQTMRQGGPAKPKEPRIPRMPQL